MFITQIARLRLEKAGVVLFRDASANKGGVTSSSLEVFSGLALSDEEHSKNMCIGADGKVPAFYDEYVKAVQVCFCIYVVVCVNIVSNFVHCN